MKHRLGFDRTHALALVAVLVLHGGLLYALSTVRVAAQPDEARILFVNLIEPAPAMPAAAQPRPAAPAAPRPERKSAPASKPDRADVVQEPAPIPKAESLPAHAATEPAVDAPTMSPAEVAPPEFSAPADADGDADGDANGNGAPASRSGAASGGPVALASELALVCSERRAPPYPSVSRRLGEAGRVVLRVELNATGRVVQAQVVDSSGFARLDAAALAAVRTWRCEPPRREGHAVGAVALQPFDFTLAGP